MPADRAAASIISPGVWSGPSPSGRLLMIRQTPRSAACTTVSTLICGATKSFSVSAISMSVGPAGRTGPLPYAPRRSARKGAGGAIGFGFLADDAAPYHRTEHEAEQHHVP